LLSCLQTLLSASTSWFSSTSSHPSLLLDLSCNAIDSRAQAALHACVQQAALIATNAMRKQQAQAQAQAQAPSADSAEPSSSARADEDRAASGSSSSRRSRAGSAAAGAGYSVVRPPSLFEHAAGASQSVWASPHLRAPSFASHLAPHVARQLQRAGCTPLPTQVLQILCAHQSATDADEGAAAAASTKSAEARVC